VKRYIIVFSFAVWRAKWLLHWQSGWPLSRCRRLKCTSVVTSSWTRTLRRSQTHAVCCTWWVAVTGSRWVASFNSVTQHLRYRMKSLSRFAMALPCLLLRSILRQIVSLMPSPSAIVLSSPSHLYFGPCGWLCMRCKYIKYKYYIVLYISAFLLPLSTYGGSRRFVKTV